MKEGCCTACGGRGVDAAGQCWDCYGTGHVHLGPCEEEVDETS